MSVSTQMAGSTFCSFSATPICDRLSWKIWENDSICGAPMPLTRMPVSRFETPASLSSARALSRSYVYTPFFEASYAGDVGVQGRLMGDAVPFITVSAKRLRSMA